MHGRHDATGGRVNAEGFLKTPTIHAFGRRKIEGLAIGAIAALSAFGLTRSVARGSATPASATAAPAMRYLAAAVAPAHRSGALDLPNIDHPRVDSWIERFSTDLRGSFATYLSRKRKYEPMISAKLADRGMPQGLIYLAMIESGFNPRATSRVHATGLWQFMTATGRQYGLTVNRRLDERKDPARATDAALAYLDRLHDRFGSWYLAAAAYNSGEGTVSKALKRVTGRTHGSDADYYRIASRLPAETRDYVPKLIAAARIGSDPVRYGFSGD